MAWGVLFVMLVAFLTGRKYLVPILTLLFAIALTIVWYLPPLTEARFNLFCTQAPLSMAMALMGGLALFLLPPLTFGQVWKLIRPGDKPRNPAYLLGALAGLTALGLFVGGLWNARNCGSCRTEAATPFVTRTQATVGVVGDHLVVVGGVDGRTYPTDVWSSTDGLVWDEIAKTGFPGRQGQAMVTFHGKLWIIGGWDGKLHNDVWCSADGKVWNHACDAPFEPRTDLGAATDGKQIWISGGKTTDGPQGDVWSTEDGVHWKRLRGKGPFLARSQHSLVWFSGGLWMLGGLNGMDQELGDIWTSPDGVAWQKAENPPFHPRSGMATVVHKDKLWVVGGRTSGTALLNPWWTGDGITWHESPEGLKGPGQGITTAASFGGRLWFLPGTDGRFFSADL